MWKGQDIENKYLLDASNNYTKFSSIAQTSDNILDFSKKHDVLLKFIYLMRDPIERTESHYTYAYIRWTTTPLEERIGANDHLVNTSRYAQQLDHYYNKFDKENILLLCLDELKDKPDVVLKRICELLEIDPDFTFSDLRVTHNKSKGAIVSRPVDRIYFKYPRLKAIAKKFPKGFRQFFRDLLLRKKI